MSKNTYQETVCFIHFNGSSKEPAIGDANYNHLYKIRQNFSLYPKTNFKPSTSISVDDGMITFGLYFATAQTWNIFKQMNTNVHCTKKHH